MQFEQEKVQLPAISQYTVGVNTPFDKKQQTKTEEKQNKTKKQKQKQKKNKNKNLVYGKWHEREV